MTDLESFADKLDVVRTQAEQRALGQYAASGENSHPIDAVALQHDERRRQRAADVLGQVPRIAQAIQDAQLKPDLWCPEPGWMIGLFSRGNSGGQYTERKYDELTGSWSGGSPTAVEVRNKAITRDGRIVRCQANLDIDAARGMHERLTQPDVKWHILALTKQQYQIIQVMTPEILAGQEAMLENELLTFVKERPLASFL